jgi:hypothetical protein
MHIDTVRNDFASWYLYVPDRRDVGSRKSVESRALWPEHSDAKKMTSFAVPLVSIHDRKVLMVGTRVAGTASGMCMLTAMGVVVAQTIENGAVLQWLFHSSGSLRSVVRPKSAVYRPIRRDGGTGATIPPIVGGVGRLTLTRPCRFTLSRSTANRAKFSSSGICETATR